MFGAVSSHLKMRDFIFFLLDEARGTGRFSGMDLKGYIKRGELGLFSQFRLSHDSHYSCEAMFVRIYTIPLLNNLHLTVPTGIIDNAADAWSSKSSHFGKLEIFFLLPDEARGTGRFSGMDLKGDKNGSELGLLSILIIS